MSGHKVSEAEFDQAMARRHDGSSPSGDALLRELREAGATGAGARGVVQWLDEGVSVDEAVASLGFFDAEPGKVASLVRERAVEVLRRHRPADPGRAREAVASHRPVDRGSGRVAKARERLALVVGPGYADAFVGLANQRALREGLSEDQVLEAIERHIVYLQKQITERSTAPHRPATTQGITRETTRSPIRRRN